MSAHTVVVRRVEDEHGARAVVDYADDVIWISDELLRQCAYPDRERSTGDLEVNGDLITFGTSGEGLGRLTYRLVGRHEAGGYHIAEREGSTP